MITATRIVLLALGSMSYISAIGTKNENKRYADFGGGTLIMMLLIVALKVL